MAEKLPLVYVDGQLSQLPTGDTAEGAALGSLTAGSGLVGGGDLQTGNKRLDVALASSASGVIFVGDSIGMDGADLVTASAALASGVAGSSASAIALASGVAAQSDANTALASGNAALDLAVNFSSSSSVELTASSVIQAGNPVGLDDAGKASVITSVTSGDTRTYGSTVVFNTAEAGSVTSTYDSTNDRVVVAYKDDGNSNYGTAIVGTVSGSSISFGTKVVFESGNTIAISTTYDSTNDRVVIVYSDAVNSEYGTAIVGTVSGTSISFGTAVVFESAATYVTGITYDSTNARVVVAYQDGGNSSYGTAIVGTVSGTSISFGTAVVFESAAAQYLSPTYDSTNDRVVIAYRDDGNSYYGTAIVGTVSGTSISFGTAVVFESASTNHISTTYDSTNDRVVVAYQDGGNSSYGTAIVGTVSGTSISFGTAVVFESATSQYISATYDSTNDRVVIAYKDDGNSQYGTAIVGTVSGTSISFGSAVVFSATGAVYFVSATYDSTNDRVVIAYRNDGNSRYGTAVVGSPGTSTFPTISSQNNFIGSAQTTVASGEPVTINVPRSIGYNNTGLSTGYFYYVDPTTSGYTTASGEPSAWNGDPSFPWSPIAKAVSSSGLLILETI
jgi:hypothetical protein